MTDSDHWELSDDKQYWGGAFCVMFIFKPVHNIAILIHGNHAVHKASWLCM